ncbi:MAG: cell division protein FtsW [Ruminococcaceae bacterium]|nr:cell division protein FtsW [Oscillospiraceae bacterium]
MDFQQHRASRSEGGLTLLRRAGEEPQRESEGSPIVKGGPDIPMLLITTILLLFGCVMVYSASAVYAEQYHDDRTYFIVRHLIFLVLAIAAAIPVVRFVTPRFWEDFSVAIYVCAIVLLILVLLVGDDLGSGAKRWLNLKVFTVQPSEIAKMALVMILAKYMSTYEHMVRSAHRFGSFLYGVVYPGCLIGGIAVLIAAERHISGIMIIGMLGISVMFMGGTKLKWIFLIIGMVALAGGLLIAVSDYAQARVDTWWNIETADRLGPAWQTIQGLMAIGSGGLFGLGLGNSRQKFGYVSQPQNDFIFTIICEELGFFGAFLVIALFVMFVWRGFHIARHAPNLFSSLLVYGLTFKVGIQVILNVAVVTNSMPNTGISLPFFSYGGTSLILQVVEVGIILAVSRYCTNKKI